MGYKIISGRYETGTQVQQKGYDWLFGSKNIQEKFDLYFHWFNIVHEIGHIIVDIEKIDMDKVDEEFFVNCFAVAYWRNVDMKILIYQDLSHMVKILIQKILIKY